MGALTTPNLLQEGRRAFVIPNFREDERACVEYEEALKAAVSRTLESAMAVLREAHASKRVDLTHAVTAARSTSLEASVLAMDSWSRYAKLVKRKRRIGRALSKPTIGELLRTLGAAGRIYRRAVNADRANSAAQAKIREAEGAVDKHDRRLETQREARELELRRFYHSEEGRAALIREPYVRALHKRVTEIRTEREQYARRIAEGRIASDEHRIREMARERYVFLSGDVSGAFFLGNVTYGDSNFDIIRDREGRDWLADHDERFRPIHRLLFDIVAKYDGTYVVRKSSGIDFRVGGADPPADVPDPRPNAPAVDHELRLALVRFAESFY